MSDDTIISMPSTGQVAPVYRSQEEEWRWCRAMADRLSDYRRERSYSRGPAPSALDIEVRCYEIVHSIERGSYRAWGKILPALIAERDTLSSAGRRVLLRTMKEAAKKLRKVADQAELRARRYDELIVQLDDPKQI
jgi:hypothetical protein